MEHNAPYLLVVEDSPEDVEALRRCFKKLSITVPFKHLESGDEALEYFDALESRGKPYPDMPTLILLDLNLPGTDGRDVLRALKGKESARRIPVIVFTTSRDDRDVSRCYEDGANCYIQKPVEMDALIAALSQLMDFWFKTAILPEQSGK